MTEPDIAEQGTARMAAIYQRFLSTEAARISGCTLELSSAGDGAFFVKLTKETAFEDTALALSFEGHAVQLDVRNASQVDALVGTEHGFPADGSYALTLELKRKEPGKEETQTRYDYAYVIACSPRTLKFHSIDDDEVRIELTLSLDGELSINGSIQGYEISEYPTPTPDERPKHQSVTIEATSSAADFKGAFESYFKTLTPLAAFPVDKLSIEHMDRLGLREPPLEMELMFGELTLGGQQLRPNLLIDEPLHLGVQSVEELVGKQYRFDKSDPRAPHGKIFNLYPGGSPFACITGLRFGKIDAGSIECTIQIEIELEAIASHNPDHRYGDAVCIVATRIDVSDGFV